MYKDRISITIDKEVRQRIKNEAVKQRRSFSSMVEMVLSKWNG
jgi:predicted HicB family RNase H-like nuclease